MSQSPLRVLLVDELPDERVMYGVGLRLLGLELSVAENADHALREAATFRPHVIVLHLGRGGWDLCDVFGRCGATSQSPVIVITADVRPDRANRSRALATQNCAAFLGKPCMHEDAEGVVLPGIALRTRVHLSRGAGTADRGADQDNRPLDRRAWERFPEGAEPKGDLVRRCGDGRPQFLQASRAQRNSRFNAASEPGHVGYPQDAISEQGDYKP